MTLDTLVAVITLAAAAYQLLPRVRQLDLSLRLDRFDWLLLWGAAAGIVYLQFYPFFAAIGATPHLGLSQWQFTPERASFVLLVGVIGVVSLRVRLSKLSRRSVPRLHALVEELLWTGDASEAAQVMERHLPRISQLANVNTRWTRIRRWLAPSLEDTLREITSLPYEIIAPQQHVPQHRTRTIARKLLSPVARFLPPPTRREESAVWLLSRVQSSPEFAAAVAQRRPYFALRLMEAPDRDTFVFMRHYFRALLADASSVLHRELRDNPSTATRAAHRFYSPSERLLSFLFNDPRVAETLSIYQAVGEAMREELLRLSRDASSDPYNLSADDLFRDEGRWDTSLFTGIAFFDHMVTSCLLGRIRSHMWLLYFETFTEEMISNHSPREPHAQRDSFYETRYTYLMYQMVSRCRDWVRIIENVSDDPDLFDVRDSAEYENDNIPKSAIICLKRMLVSILTAAKLNDSFKCRIAHIVFELYFNLRRMNQPLFASVLAKSLREGVPYDNDADARYRSQIRECFRSFDKIPHMAHGPQRETGTDPLRDFIEAVFPRDEDINIYIGR